MNKNNGAQNLANVLQNRFSGILRDSDGYMSLDFGVIESDGSLSTNSSGSVKIPSGAYLIAGSLTAVQCSGGTDIVNGHSHDARVNYPRRISRGDRVIVAWVGNDAVVLDTIRTASEVI